MAALSSEEKLLWRKVTVVGNHGVGKTSIIKQFCERKFNPQTRPTVGADYGHKHCIIGTKEVEVTFWDLAGGQEYHETRQQLITGSDLCLLILDVRDLSDKIVNYWTEQLSEHEIADLIKTESEKATVMKRLEEIESKYNLTCALISAKTDKDIIDQIVSLLSQTITEITSNN